MNALWQYWHPVLWSKEVADKPVPVKLLDQPLVIWRANENLSVFYDLCIHRGVLKRIEADQDFPLSPIHGNSGPIYIKRKHVFDLELSAQEQALLDAVTRLGLPRFDDQNEPDPYGIAPTARNIKHGQRQFAAVVYLGPGRGRP
jgi:hypothetical protein